MAAAHDILALKTEAELRFFVENPSYYQPELVAAAQRERRRRGPGAAPATLPAAEPAAPALEPAASAPLVTPAPDYAGYEGAAEHAAPQPTQRPWLLLGSVAAVFFLAGLGFWFKPRAPPAAPAAAIATAPAQAPPAAAPPVATTTAAPPAAVATAPAATSLRLEEAPASPIPYYDTDSYVEKALGQVPAQEKRNEQLLSQYRAISRLFWAAQNPSSYLIGQAQAGRANAMLGAQARMGLGLWHDFNRTQAYRYSFGPVMADHLARMKVIAQYQREALGELANDTEAQRPPHLDDDQTLTHQQVLPHLLAALAPQAGPATAHR